MFLAFFAALREARVPVTPREFLDLMRALEAEVAERSVDDFYRLARALLVKDERHLDKFDLVFAAVFRGAPAPPAAVEPRAPPVEWLRRAIDRHLAPAERAELEALGLEALMAKLARRLAEQRERRQAGGQRVGAAGVSPFGADGENPAGVRIGQDRGRRSSAVKIWDRREFKDFAGDEALGPRNIRLALSRLRRFAREGAAEELDLDGTIRSTADHGFLDLKLRPERRNAVKVLLFLDVGGSMDWHVEAADGLFSAARLQFKRLEHFYFHNCLYESVWRSNRRRAEERIPTQQVINSFGRDHRVVFVGDAAMGPHEILAIGGSIEGHNPESGETWLKRALDHWPRSVWINPSPPEQWAYAPSTRLISALFGGRMHPLTPDGVEAAMRALAR